MIRQFERFNWVFLFILTLITAIGSDLIINVLLGSKYVKSIPILSIINFSSFFMTYFLVYGVVLSSKGYFLFGAKLYFVKLIFLVIIGVCFVHPALLNLGAVGLALTLLFSNIFIGILVVFFAKIKITGIQVFQEKRLIIYSILFGVVAFFLYQLTNSIISKVLYLFVVMVLFYTLAYLLKLIKRNDFQMLNQMLSLKKMGTYIKGEMKNDTY